MEEYIFQYIKDPKICFYIFLIILLVKYYDKIQLLGKDLFAAIVYGLSFPHRIYHQRLDFLERDWTSEGDCTSKDKCAIYLSISNSLDGELICNLTPDGGRFYGLSIQTDYHIIRFLRLMLFKSIKLKIFNIRMGNEICYGFIKVKILSSPSRFSSALISVRMDKYLIEHFKQKKFILFPNL